MNSLYNHQQPASLAERASRQLAVNELPAPRVVICTDIKSFKRAAAADWYQAGCRSAFGAHTDLHPRFLPSGATRRGVAAALHQGTRWADVKLLSVVEAILELCLRLPWRKTPPPLRALYLPSSDTALILLRRAPAAYTDEHLATKMQVVKAARQEAVSRASFMAGLERQLATSSKPSPQTVSQLAWHGAVVQARLGKGIPSQSLFKRAETLPVLAARVAQAKRLDSVYASAELMAFVTRAHVGARIRPTFGKGLSFCADALSLAQTCQLTADVSYEEQEPPEGRIDVKADPFGAANQYLAYGGAIEAHNILAQKVNDKWDDADALIALAASYRRMGRWDLALNCYSELPVRPYPNLIQTQRKEVQELAFAYEDEQAGRMPEYRGDRISMAKARFLGRHDRMVWKPWVLKVGRCTPYDVRGYYSPFDGDFRYKVMLRGLAADDQAAQQLTEETVLS